MMKRPSWAALGACILALPLNGLAVGAIAVDDEEGQKNPGYGFATGMETRKKAEAAALKECRASGNKNCKVAVWFEQCGAYAASSRHYGIGWGSSKRIAEAKAKEECDNSTCRIIVSQCED